MKNGQKRPVLTFRDKYLAVVMILALFSGDLFAQDSAKYSYIPGYGFRYKRHIQDSLSVMPLSTSPFNPYRAGGYRFDSTNRKLQLYYAGVWNDYGKAVQLTDSTFKVGKDTITIHGTGGGGGTGTVTSFSSGNLSPLFTTNVSTGSSTPSQSFTLSNPSSYTLFGNNTGSSAAPAYFSPVLASALFANQGTGTTILHGNAAGNPIWAALNLATDVTGNLSVNNLNSGISAGSTTFWAGDGSWKLPPFINQLTGDITAGPGSGSQAATLSNTAVTPGSYTNTNITVDSKGRVTSASNGSGGTTTLPTTQIPFGSVGNTATSKPEFNYDSVLHRFYSDTAIHKRVMIGVTGLFNQDTLYAYLDSYGNDVGGDGLAFGVVRIFAANLQLYAKNLSISGSTVMNRSPVNPYGGSPQNLVQQFCAARGTAGACPVYGANMGYIWFGKGLNDVGYTGANYTPLNFSIDYQTCLDTALARGWPANRIILFTPWYIQGLGYTSYSSTTGTGLATAARHIEFVDTVIAIGTRRGNIVYDAYRGARYQCHGDSTLIYTDGIHANANGYAYYGTQGSSIINYIVANSGQALGVNGPGEFTTLRISNADSAKDGYRYRVAVFDSSNRISYAKPGEIVRSNWGTTPDASRIHINNKILISYPLLTAPTGTDREVIQAGGGGAQFGFTKANGTLPGGLAGNAVWTGMLGLTSTSVGFSMCYNYTTASANPYALQVLGGPLIVRGVSLSGSTDIQLNGVVGVFNKMMVGSNALPGSFLHLAPGTATTGSAPFGFTVAASILNTTPAEGKMETDTSGRIFYSPHNLVRRQLVYTDSVGAVANGRIPIGNGLAYTSANITGSNGITITNGAGTIDVSGAGLTTLYNGNGSLSGDRVVTMGANDISFSGLSAGSSFIASVQDQIGLASGTSYIQLNGGLHLKNTQSSDANLTVTENMTQIYLDTITASRNVVLPATNVGGTNANLYYLINDNYNNGFSWTATGQALKDANLNTVTTLDNKTSYIIRAESNGFNDYFKIISVTGLTPTTSSSAGTLTVGYSTYDGSDYLFTGTTSTWTLPAVSATRNGYKFFIKNAGSGSITLNSSGGGNDIYDTGAVNTITITAGSARTLVLINSIFYLQ